MLLLFAFGSPHRDHLVSARVEFLSQPPDIPSLAGRVPTLVHKHDRRPVQKTQVLQAAQFRLQLRQPLLVFFLVHFQGQVHAIKGADSAGGVVVQRGGGAGRDFHRLFEGRTEGLGHLHVAEFVVRGRHQGPGRIGCRGFAQHVFGGRQVGIIVLVLPTLGLAHLPRKRGVFLQLLEALLLFLLADVQEEFEYERAIVRKLPLEDPYVFKGLFQVRLAVFLAGLRLDTRVEYLPVPTVVEYGNAPIRRQHQPVSAHGREHLLQCRGRRDVVNLEAPWVHRLKQPVEHRPFSAGVPPFEDNAHGPSDFAQFPLQLRQPEVERGHGVFVLILVE